MLPCGMLSVLVTMALAGSAYGSYFALAPNTFRPGSDFAVEISVIGPAAASVEATLGIPETTPLVTKEEVIINGRALVSLRIPSEVADGSYTLTIVGKGVGGVEVFRNSSIIQDDSENSLLLIQTDKSMYKPLQTVKFRIVCVTTDLIPRTDLATDISIFDHNDNKLEEWLAVTGESGVIEKFYKLSDLPPLGKWKIQAKNKFAMQSKEFSVEQYVLPKFEVTTEAVHKKFVTDEMSDFSIKVTAKYTYGKSVLGMAKFIFGEGSKAYIETVTLAADANGVHTQTFAFSKVKHVLSYGYPNSYLKLHVNVTENATTVTESSDELSIGVYDQRINLEFLSTSSQVFHPGLDVNLQVQVTDIVDNEPAHVGAMIELSADLGSPTGQKATDEIDAQGMASQSFRIPTNNTNTWGINFMATLIDKNGKRGLTANHRLLPYKTNLKTMITVEVPTAQPILSGVAFEIQIQASSTLAKVAYLVVARGEIVESGAITMTGLSKTHTITTNRKMTPHAQVLVYGIVTKNGMSEVIVDSVDVQVKGVFDNEVSLTFDKAEGRSGTNVDVTVATAPNSRFYILGVDKSVMLLGSGNDFSETEVINGIRRFNLGETPNYDSQEDHGGGADFMFRRPGGGSENNAPTSAGQLLKTKGLVFLTGLIVENSPSLQWRQDVMFAMAGPVAPADNAGGVQPPVVEKTQYAEVGRVRKSFPEAWLWMDGTVDAQGNRVFTETIPDTITEWVATAFALSPTKGLAITAQSAKLRSFQPFFASLTLPYAIKRGEIFQLRVTIFNYMEQDTPVKVTLKRSDDFGVLEKDGSGKSIVVSKDVVDEVQVKSNIPYSLVFSISAKKLGPIKLHVVAQPDETTREKGDSLERIVLVKPEGIVQREVVGETVELDADNTAFRRVIPITYPEEVVAGSRRLEVKVTGDVMGPAIDNLEHLLRVPTGCGEQNMLTLVPNIVVYKYLKTVNRLTTDIEDKAIANMKTGYQRELGYKRKDGSYSAFGDSDESGSTWLTAFVMKCFSQARNEITVDGEMMKKAFGWLKLRQDTSNGKFRLEGQIHHQEMLGGSSADKALTAFIYIALKESEYFLMSETDRNSLTLAKTYLENLVVNNQLTTTYEMAIVAYALTLADSNQAAVLLDKLQGLKKPWENPKKDEPVPAEGNAKRGDMIMESYYPPRATAGDVETWSYVLLAYAHKQDIVMGRAIMKWLLTQQNDRGGFYSTQDTVLGLQSLSEYAAIVYKAPQTDITLVVKGNTESHTFLVQREQLLLLQSHVFPEDTTSIELNASGRGLAVVKVVWQYNTLEDQTRKTDTKEIISKVDPAKINDDLYQVTACFKSPNSGLGMSVMDFETQTSHRVINLDQLRKDKNIKRADFINNHLHLYYDEPKPEFQCAQIIVERESPIVNIQRASLTTFAYYQPEIQEEKSYSVADASQVIDICVICETNDCPSHCEMNKCKNCGSNCPRECDTSGATTWRLDSMLLSLGICLLLSLIMAI